MERGLLSGVGFCMALVGGLFFAYFLVTLASGGDGETEPGVLAGLVVFFGGMMASGLYLAWRMLHNRPTVVHSSGAGRPGVGARGAPAAPPPPPHTDAERERRVLRFAESEHGRVTIPEVAARCDMTIAESKATLDVLVLHEVAEIQVTATGVLVYAFPGFLSDQDKARATDF